MMDSITRFTRINTIRSLVPISHPYRQPYHDSRRYSGAIAGFGILSRTVISCSFSQHRHCCHSKVIMLMGIVMFIIAMLCIPNTLASIVSVARIVMIAGIH